MAAKALWYVKDGSSLKTFCKTWENVPLEKELSRLDESKGYKTGNVAWETHFQNVQRRDSSNCGPRRKSAKTN
jgi:hypothetical protein